MDESADEKRCSTGRKIWCLGMRSCETERWAYPGQTGILWVRCSLRYLGAMGT